MSYGHKVFLKPDGHINNVGYPAEVPTYALSKSRAIEDGDIMPVVYSNKFEYSLTRVTIAQMIDFRDREVPIRIMKDSDIIEIAVTLKSYLDELRTYEEVPEAKEYLIRSGKFYNELQRSLTIISKRDPRAMKIIHRQRLLELFKFGV